MSLKSPESKQAPKEIEIQKAKHSWNSICKEIQKPTNSINETVVINELGLLIDHFDSLTRQDRKKIKHAFSTLGKHDQTFLNSKLKPALMEKIISQSGQSQRQQNIKTAEMLGLLGNWFGLGVDKDISQALGSDSTIKRQHIKAAASTAVGAGLAYVGAPYTSEVINPILKAGKALTYLAQASVSSEELSAPQLKPSPAKKDIATPAKPSPSPNPSPEIISSATNIPTKEPTKPPTPTKTLEPTKPPTATTEPTQQPFSKPNTNESENEAPTEETTESEEPPKENMIEIGNQNLAEFFLGQWILELKGKGVTLWENDASYRERVPKHNAESDCITMVYLGTDNERDRDKRATSAARSDVIIVERFDPHTFKSVFISINRDLVVPEAMEQGLLRVNELTTLPSRNINPYPLIQRMVETATNWRVDGIAQTNIDFVNGYDEYYDEALKEGMPGKNSIIDRLIPEGLEVNPPDAIDDPQYPKGYGVQNVHFSPGPQTLHGQDLVRYARARKGTNNNDYERSTRQREVGFKVLRSLASKIADDLEQDNTHHLDLAIEALKEQQEVGNFFQYDIDIIGIAETIRDNILEIQSMPNGDKIIAKLAGNSMSNIAQLLGAEASKRYGLPLGDPNKGFVSFGLSSANGTLEEHPNAQGASVTRLKGSGPYLNRKSADGNYIEYWQGMRAKMIELEAA